jgi:hypothetical protein
VPQLFTSVEVLAQYAPGVPEKHMISLAGHWQMLPEQRPPVPQV